MWPMMRPNFSSSYELPLKLGLIQTLTILCCLRPDLGRKADWLLEQCHRIWLAVGINGSWKRLFLAWLIALKWMIHRQRREGFIFFLYIYSFTVLWKEKMPSYVAWKFKKFIWLFISSCFIYGTNVSVSRSWIPLQVESLTANRVPFDLPTNECKSKYCPS